MDLEPMFASELDVVGVIQGFAHAIAWAGLLSILLMAPLFVVFSCAIRRRRFWGAAQGGEGEVEFGERGIPGMPYAVSIRQCSVFGCAGAVACGRQCLDSAFRRRWPPPLPLSGARR